MKNFKNLNDYHFQFFDKNYNFIEKKETKIMINNNKKQIFKGKSNSKFHTKVKIALGRILISIVY